MEEVEARREEEGEWYSEMERRERERQREERWEKIGESRFNRWYKEVKGRGIPEYLKKGWGESRWRRVARFRLGSEMKEAYYWEEEEKKKCRLCVGGKESRVGKLQGLDGRERELAGGGGMGAGGRGGRRGVDEGAAEEEGERGE